MWSVPFEIRMLGSRTSGKTRSGAINENIFIKSSSQNLNLQTSNFQFIPVFPKRLKRHLPCTLYPHDQKIMFCLQSMNVLRHCEN